VLAHSTRAAMPPPRGRAARGTRWPRACWPRAISSRPPAPSRIR